MKYATLWIAAVLAVGIAGCGGGGGSSSGTTRLGVFVTDSFRDDFSHVWATIFKIELVSSTGSTATIFDDASGRLIDLRTLHDATGSRFSFLSHKSIPAGTWSSVRVTVANAMTLIAAGSSTGSPVPIADSVPRDTSGHPQITFNLPAPRPFGSSDDLVVDFDLASFAIVGGKIVPSLREGGKTTLGDKSRHENEDFEGTISNLSGIAPAFTFMLTHGTLSFTVATSAATTIFNGNALPNPTLANGQRVEVRGKFDTVTDQLNAAGIKIEDASEDNLPEVKGAPSAINAGAGTFTLTTHEVHGFVPTTTTVNVVTNANTVFRGDSGVTLSAADFFTRLTTAQFVEVEGTYNSQTNTLTATRAKLDDSEESGSNDNGTEAEAKGTTTNINAGAGTLTLSPVSEFEGFVLSGNSLNVTTSGNTIYKAKDGTVMTAGAFFGALTATTTVKAEGLFSSGVLAATKLEIL